MLFRSLILGLSMALCAPVLAPAQDIPTRIEDVVRVELLPGWRHEDGTHFAGLAFELAPGWKTYWRSPGDGGLPTHLGYDGSKNVSDLRVIWPRPEVFRTRGLRSIGYQDRVVLPLQIAPKEATPIDLKLHLAFGVCEDVCIPVHMSFKHQLPADLTQHDTRIVEAIKTRPKRGKAEVSCDFKAHDGGMAMRVKLHQPALPGAGEALVIEPGSNHIWISEPEMRRDGDYVVGRATMLSQTDAQVDPDPAQMRVTLISSAAAVSYEGCAVR